MFITSEKDVVVVFSTNLTGSRCFYRKVRCCCSVRVCTLHCLGVDFINVFTRSFYTLRSRKHKKLLDLTVFFVLLGSAHVKAARKMLVKLTICRRGGGGMSAYARALLVQQLRPTQRRRGARKRRTSNSVSLTRI